MCFKKNQILALQASLVKVKICFFEVDAFSGLQFALDYGQGRINAVNPLSFLKGFTFDFSCSIDRNRLIYLRLGII